MGALRFAVVIGAAVTGFLIQSGQTGIAFVSGAGTVGMLIDYTIFRLKEEFPK